MRFNLNTALVGSLSVLAISGCQLISTNNEQGNPDLSGGKILLYTQDGTFIDAANVGNLPDMVTFVDERTLISANEGEPEDDYSADAEGSVSIIRLAGDKSVKTVNTMGFAGVSLEGEVRIKPGSTPAADLEPEYVAVSEDGKTAWVSLQENNAVAIVDIKKNRIEKVKGLGKVEVNGQAIDIVDDGEVRLSKNAPKNIFALHMPDTMVSYRVNGKDYFITANEGDDREYDAWEDLEKANELELSAQLKEDLLGTDMKKLRVLIDLGESNGVYNELYMTGTRSFSIWDADANRVFDSANMIETELATNYYDVFNTRVDDTDDADDIAELKEDGVAYEMVGDTAYFWEGIDARSLKKGAEPEALAIANISNNVFAYVGLEKQGGFMVFNVTSPTDVSFIQYFNDINYSALPSQAGDLAPEGMVTFAQNGKHYLAVANELSSSVAIFELADDGKASKLTSLTVGSFDEGAAEILDYNPQNQSLYVTNGEEKRIDIIDVANPAQSKVSGMIDFSAHGDSLQSVSVMDGVVAIAVE
jgi:DNA-binding beta-propeller fold protein YncE